MTLAPWRSVVSRALHRNRSQPQARYAQLATVQSNGFPANRTVVFRGFRENSNQLRFITDARSQKVEQMAKAELCWYFPTTREQLRLQGYLQLVGQEDRDLELQMARRSLWHDLSDNARVQFSWPDPKMPRAQPEVAFTVEAPSPIEPSANFCLLLLNVIYVDHLELRGDPQSRWIYTSSPDDEWIICAVNP